MAKIISNHGDYGLNGPSMACGDHYKNGTSHKLISSKKQVGVLIDLIKRFKLPDIKLSKITNTSFTFSSDNTKQQVFVFRLCRYIRNKDMLDILEKTIELNSKNKLAIYHSFVLAHHIKKFKLKKNIPYYCNGMDLVFMLEKLLNFSFNNHDEFLKYLNSNDNQYSHIFYPDSIVIPAEVCNFRKNNPRLEKTKVKEYSLFKSYIEEGKYKKAINLIKNRV